MNGLIGKGNRCNNSPQYSSPAAILENTNTKMQRDLIAHTACHVGQYKKAAKKLM